MGIQLLSKVQWLSQADRVVDLRKEAQDKHRRIVLDLQNIIESLNTVNPSGTSGVLPILHPGDPTSGVFPLTGPIGIQIRIGGVAIMTFDSTGMRMGA